MTKIEGASVRYKIIGLFFAGVAALLAGCAPLQESKKLEQRDLVYPAAPDAPRFVFERTIYGSADVVPVDADFSLRSAVTGESQRSEGLTKPYAVAVHKGRVFVSDSADRFIKVFDIPESRYFTLGDTDDGTLAKPLGMDIDGAGNLYVADASGKAIMIYTRDGKFLRKISLAKMVDRLSSVAVDKAGTRVFVVDIGGIASQQHQIRVFNAVSGDHLFDFGKRGDKGGEFNLPRDLAVGKDGHLYVVDGGNFRVSIFDAKGGYLQSFGTVGKQIGSFARPKEIAADADGNVYVVDSAFGNVQIFTPDGELLMFVGDRSETDGPGRYMLPSGVAVDEDGRIYMVDQWFRKVDVYRPVSLKVSEGYLGVKPKAVPAKR